MIKSQSQFIKIQPFIQSLRSFANNIKDSCNEEYQQHGSSQIIMRDKQERSGKKSLTKSQILSFSRKTSINLLKQNFNNVWRHQNDNLFIYFNKIFSKTDSLSQSRPLKTNRVQSLSKVIENLEILILFNVKSVTENQHVGSGKKVKMTINLTQISIQDEFKVKRSFKIDFIQKMDQSNCLQIIVPKQLTTQNVSLNGKKLICENNEKCLSLRENKVCELNPWQLINEQKNLLQNKILFSERPKSKIKWNFSSQSEEKKTLKSSLIFNNNKKIDDNSEKYGFKSPKHSVKQDIISFKSKTHLTINPNKSQKRFTNIFQTPIKNSTVSTQMSSTIKSPQKSKQKLKSSMIIPESKRKINTEPLRFRESKRFSKKEIEENPSQNNSRSKSSFRNLKERNDYFQMRQSQRKKSIKKDLNNYLKNLQPNNSQKMSPKQSEIKQEYGL